MKQLLILFGDVVILYLSLWLTLILRYQSSFSDQLWRIHFLPFTVLFVIWIIVFFIIDLYSIQSARNNIHFFSLVGKAFLINAILALAFFYLAPGDLIDVRPKTNLLLSIAIVAILFTLWRQVFNKLAATSTLAQNIFIFGRSEKTTQIMKELQHNPQLGYRVVGIVPDGEEQNPLENIPMIKNENWLTEAQQRNVRTIVTTLDPNERPELASQLLDAIRNKMEVFSFQTFYEKITGKIPVMSIDQTWFLDNLSESTKRVYDIVSRVADIVLAVISLLITLPFVPFIWVIIKIDDNGSSFFMQHRMGRGGKQFMAIKFRSMKMNAEAAGPQWAQKNDPRVTHVGRFMRKTRIDEIPQLINVLKGDMSFVGPRPERPEFVEQLKENIPFYNERHIVKPGLTGWAQINFPYGASQKDALEKLQYDLYYIKNRSLILDLSILLKTIRIILSGSGQ